MALTLVLGATLLTAAPAAAAPRTDGRGMTWTVLETRGGLVRAGADAATDPYLGDTPVTTALPLLCLNTDDEIAPPAGWTFDLYINWSFGRIAATAPVAGTALTSRDAADDLCEARFGGDWYFAEFHDGWFPESEEDDEWRRGGWSFWAQGALPAGTRFWVAIDDQPANPWDA